MESDGRLQNGSQLPDQGSGARTKEEAPSAASGQVPLLSLPKGGGAIRGIGEKFGTNPVTGTGSLTVPIATSPGRSGFGPQLTLSYDSGAGNGSFGLGWNLSLPSITRKTDKGLPQYRDAEESDEFILSGAEDLVPVLTKTGSGQWEEKVDPRTIDSNQSNIQYDIKRYCPRIEGLFARIERWTNQNDPADCFWRSISKDNITTWYGRTAESRIVDPNDKSRIYSWLICESHDDKGNVIVYGYEKEDVERLVGYDLKQSHEKNRTNASRTSNRYLKRIRYGNHKPYFPQLLTDKPWPSPPGAEEPDGSKHWYFEVVLDYGEHDKHSPTPKDQGQIICRNDPFSTYRPGFEVRTYRLCQRVLMFHHFPDELQPGHRVGADCLVRSTDFDYRHESDPTHAENPIFSLLEKVTQRGYKRLDENHYTERALPPLEFSYTEAEIKYELKEIDAKSLENLPQGLDGSLYQWADLDGEGAGGILTEQGGAWFYKRNLSPLPIKDGSGQPKHVVRFAPVESISPLPSFSALSNGKHQIMDLAGDGQVDVVTYEEPTPGFFERTQDGNWQPYKPFKSLPNIDWKNPNLKFVDLTGDGHADLFITEEQAFIWYASLAEEGFGPAQKTQQLLDEEKGSRLVFADGTQSIYLSDMSGDGLTDLVRIRNGEVCYWPNLGYCRFGAKVTMDNPPWFESPDQFDQKRIRLADIDGSGVTDIIYLKHDVVQIYLNQSGNSWADAIALKHLPAIDNTTNVMVTDLMGNGTACLVWSSPLPGNAHSPMRYVDLMGGQKPHLLTRTVNNLGAETRVHYAPSTKFYLKDKQEGKEWITRLHFPVHCVERVETYDHISKNCFVTRYAYHHGYFDGHEREFRGFGMVEQWDTEEFKSLSGGEESSGSTNIDERYHVPPVHTKTWFHTGVYLGREHVSNFFAGMLHANDIGEYFREPAIAGDDTEARKFLLDDTVLDEQWTIEEAREACRALKGSMLRQEVYALDGSDQEAYPYTVTEQNFTIRCVQPKANNQHGVFFAHPREAINYHYERNPYDPRLSHTLTLAVDDYGNVLRSVAIGYCRRPGVNSLLAEQEETHITFTANRVSNYPQEHDWYRVSLPVETCTFEIVNPWEPEYSGPRIVPFQFKKLDDEIESLWSKAQLEPSSEKLWPYEKWDWRRQADQCPPDTRLRLIENVRTLYRPDDMGDSQNDTLALLPLGTVASLALPGETYKLALTQELLDQIYERDGQNLLPANLLSGGGGKRCGYIYQDGNWWIPSGRIFNSPDNKHTPLQEHAEAHQHFFLPRRYRDPFYYKVDNTDKWETETFVDYDAYDLLTQETRDALDNRVTVGKRKEADDILEENGNDYRVLQPRIMMDPNRNCSEVIFDALGLVVGTAIMGKPEDNPAKGDQIDANFKPDLTNAEIDAFYDVNNPHTLALNHLQNATTRIIYDLDRFQLSCKAHPGEPEKWQPVFVATLAREIHVNDPGGQNSKIQLSFSYSDGFGREIQKKIQAEKGKVPQRDADGKIVVGPDNQPVMSTNEVSPRWVGSGWTIFNNKGKPVRQFEPFFTDTHKPDFDTRIGVSPVLFYDPVERVIATLHPNDTYEKVVFDPWQQMTYDVNDTVALDPHTDSDIQGYVEKYCASLSVGWKTWLQQRNVDPNNPPADTGGTDPERDAAVRALKHANTPTFTHLDSLGRSFLTVADNGNDSRGDPQEYTTRIVQDIEGNQREVIDAKDRLVMRYDYDLLGNRIHQASMEAGQRWMLNDVAGNPIRAWDNRGHNFTTVYDHLRRPIEQWVRGTDAVQSDPRTLNNNILFAKTEYGESETNADLNLRTRVFKQYDSAGIVTNKGTNSVSGEEEAYDFKDNLLRSTRKLCKVFDETVNQIIEAIPDWKPTGSAPDMEAETYASSTRYDALNRPVSLTAPDNSVIHPIYNEANLLNALQANLRGDAVVTEFVTNIDYNAKGQRVLINYATKDGAGVSTTYNYDPATFRLTHLKTRRNATGFDITDRPGELQNIYYTYDPAGNITHIQDDAQQTIYFKNQIIEPSNDYKYDPIYRLIEASGREHLGQIGTPIKHSYNDYYRTNLAHPGDGKAMGRYCEAYVYDEVGNILDMIHRRSCLGAASWRRSYTYNETSQLENSKESNRLTSTTVSGLDEIYSTADNGYDAHGNMLKMPHLQPMQWDFQDRLMMTQRQQLTNEPDEEGEERHGERTWYVYDAAGQRVRKVTQLANGNLKDERIYLAGFEVYREHSGGIHPGLVRKTLHVMDDKQRIALVETRNGVGDGSPEQLIRYQFSNHLGSAALELDQLANEISYEEYMPFGCTSYQAVNKDIKSAAKQYRYTGKERDEESGLYYHGARYYVPWLGRWNGPDSAELVDGLNLYVYVRNNPVIYIDPLGLWSWKSFGKGAGKAALGIAVGVVVVAAVAATGGAAAVVIAGALGASSATAATTGAVVAGSVYVGAAAYGGVQIGKDVYEASSGESHSWAGNGSPLTDEATSEAAGCAVTGAFALGLMGKSARSQRVAAENPMTGNQAMARNLINERVRVNKAEQGKATFAQNRSGGKLSRVAESNPVQGGKVVHAEPQVTSRGTTVSDQVPCPDCATNMMLRGVEAVVPKNTMPERAGMSPKSTVLKAASGKLPIESVGTRTVIPGAQLTPLDARKLREDVEEYASEHPSEGSINTAANDSVYGSTVDSAVVSSGDESWELTEAEIGAQQCLPEPDRYY